MGSRDVPFHDSDSGARARRYLPLRIAYRGGLRRFFLYQIESGALRVRALVQSRDKQRRMRPRGERRGAPCEVWLIPPLFRFAPQATPEPNKPPPFFCRKELFS